MSIFYQEILSKEVNSDDLTYNNPTTSDDLIKEFKKHAAPPHEIMEDAKIIANYLLRKKDFTALDKGRLLRIAGNKNWNVDDELAEMY